MNVVAYPDLVPVGTKAGLLSGRPMNSKDQAIYAVRKVSQEELADAKKTGEFLMPPTGSTKHGVGKKWWSPADDQGLFGRDWSKGTGGAIVRVPMSEFKPTSPISIKSAQIWNEQSRTWDEID